MIYKLTGYIKSNAISNMYSWSLVEPKNFIFRFQAFCLFQTNNFVLQAFKNGQKTTGTMFKIL